MMSHDRRRVPAYTCPIGSTNERYQSLKPLEIHQRSTYQRLVDAWHIRSGCQAVTRGNGTYLLGSLTIASGIGLLGRLLVAGGSLASIASGTSLGPVGCCSGRLLSSCCLLLLLVARGCLGWCVGLAGPCL